ncbi:uncharacterized protein LOC128953673 [Oppia nitens]|uniref:uncharacterized protein LOC128953673 n=1 Tax=Oppia nitens TaxID=1686743 RepID=UPI0023DCBE37|nr:uncharacterized protein LOC128953673 [Oppia nitens]
MKIHVIIVCVLVLIGYSYCQQNNANGAGSGGGGVNLTQNMKCNKKTYKEMDGLIARMLTFGNSGRKFPESATHVSKYCDDTKTAISKIEKLNKNCMKGLVKQVLSVTTYSAKKTFGQLCRQKSGPSKRMQEMLEAAKCLNKASDEIQRCYNITIDHFFSLKSVDDKVKIPMACCAYHKKNHCMSKLSDKVNTCSEKQVDIAIRFIESISGSSLNLVCAEYNDSSDKCDQFNNFKTKSEPKLRTKSFFLPLIELFDSFDEV